MSSLLIYAASAAGYAKIAPRKPNTLGLLGPFDANIIGGALIGAGMAISGSCPGTVLAQVGVGISSGVPALAGGILGGILWSGYLRERLAVSSVSPGTAAVSSGSNDQKNTATRPTTLDQLLGASSMALVAASFATLLAACVLALSMLTPRGPAARLVAPAIGGLLIGSAQLASLLLRRSALGVSTAYELLGDAFWTATLGSHNTTTNSGNKAQYLLRNAHLIFTAGITVGAFAIRTAFPVVADVPDAAAIFAWQSALGGLLVVLGGRIAGGCTSGHGISGMASLSLSSFVTIASLFGTGLGVARVLA
jgi:uncharacterized membrane protein YedE/YeeE